MRIAILIGLLWAVTTQADSIPQGQIAQELKAESVLPLGPSVPNQLAGNLLFAQAQVTYSSLESLQLSMESVLKAIGLYVWEGGPSSITSETAEPLVFLQSRIAINPALTVELSTSNLYFGEQSVTVPEPTILTFLLLVLGGGMVWWGVRVPEHERISRRLRRYQEWDRKRDLRVRI